MKAATLVEQHAPLVVSEVEVPGLEVGQVPAKVDPSGICGKHVRMVFVVAFDR